MLVVGGSATSRLILHDQLAGWDMKPQLATSGAAALQLLHTAVQQNHPIPVALIDVILPGMSGIELARRIGQDPVLGQTRLVVLTSTAATVDGSHPHVSAYLSKPVRSSQLYDCLVKALAPARTDPRLTARVGATAPTHTPALLGRLLVAEDNATNQLVARAMLSQLGYRVDIAANGLEALAALERTSYAAVLMDCQMPEMDGYTATEAIRRSEIRSGHHTPIIAVTAGAFEGDQQRCLAAGMDDYISKPIKLIELEDMLNKWVSCGYLTARWRDRRTRVPTRPRQPPRQPSRGGQRGGFSHSGTPGEGGWTNRMRPDPATWWRAAQPRRGH